MRWTFALPGAFESRLRRLAGRLHVSSQEVRDLAQAVCLGLLESGQMGRGGPEAATVDRMTVNVARREQRRSARVVLTNFHGAEEIQDEGPDPEALVMMKQRAEFWHAMLGEVPEEERAAFVDHEILGRSFPEIAAARGIAVSTAHERSRKGLEHLSRAVGRWRAEQRRRGLDDTIPSVLFDVSVSRRLFRAVRSFVARAPAVPAALLGAGVLMGDVSRQAPWPERGPEPIGHPVVPLAAAEPAPASSVLPIPATVSPRAPPPGLAPGDPLEDELIQRARGALGAGDALEARRRLEEHLRRFPLGRRAAERDALLRRLAR